MEPSLREQPKMVKKTRSTVSRYVWSFVWMVVFTIFAFYLVMYPQFSVMTTFWLILGAAVIQVVLQLSTFMHLHEKGHTIPIIFMALGLLIAVISVVGIILL
jgi:cytochrome c oxidase subunit 4